MNQWMISNNLIRSLSVDKREPFFYQQDGRFLEDQIGEFDENRICLVDGVILNSKELMQQSNASSFKEYVLNASLKKEEFFSEFRGFFSGVTKNEKHYISYTNQTGDAPVFWYCKEQLFLVSNSVDYIYNELKAQGILCKVDSNAVKYLLTFGYMIDSSTLVSDIKRVPAGCYIEFDGENVSQHRYHQFSNKPMELDFNQAIELVDKEFNKAIERCMNKDVEYGYESHLVDISGGLDSRVINAAATRLGYQNIFNVSYSQFESDENKYAQKVSEQLGNPYMHLSLNYPTFIFSVEELVNLNYGLSIYFGITGGVDVLSSLNFDKFGLEHTGQLGDVAVGTFGGSKKKEITNLHKYSEKIPIDISQIAKEYENEEIFNIYIRGFLGALSTHMIRRNYTYPVSPFLDVEFLQTCLSIPEEYRSGHRLYWAWMNQYYKELVSLKSTRQKAVSKLDKMKNRIKYYWGRITTKRNSNNMNPIEYWYQNNDDIRNFIRQYYSENELYCKPWKKEIDDMYQSKSPMDKLMAISAIAAIKKYSK